MKQIWTCWTAQRGRTAHVERMANSRVQEPFILMMVAVTIVLVSPGCKKKMPERPVPTMSREGQSQKTEQATTLLNSRGCAPAYRKYKRGSSQIAMLPMVSARGRMIEWVMATAGEQDEPGAVMYEGESYLKVGIPDNLIKRQLDYFEGRDGTLGLVYSAFKEQLVNPIERIAVVPAGERGDALLSEFENLWGVELQIRGTQFPLCVSFEYDPETGEFPWYRKQGAETEVRYFARSENVPQEYRPFLTLRILGLDSYDGMLASPQFNAQGVSLLEESTSGFVQVSGLKLITKTETGNVAFDAFAIKKRSDIKNTIQAVVIRYGDGRYQMATSTSADGTPIELITIANRRVGVQQLLVEPISEETWSCRQERLKPYRFPL